MIQPIDEIKFKSIELIGYYHNRNLGEAKIYKVNFSVAASFPPKCNPDNIECVLFQIVKEESERLTLDEVLQKAEIFLRQRSTIWTSDLDTRIKSHP